MGLREEQSPSVFGSSGFFVGTPYLALDIAPIRPSILVCPHSSVSLLFERGPPMAAPDVSLSDKVQLRVVTFQGDQLGENVSVWVCTASTLVKVDLDDFAATFDGLMAPLYKPILTSSATYRGVSGRIIFPVINKTIEFASIANVGPGTSGAISAPTQTCGLITKRTGILGPGGRGRNYLPFMSTNDIDTGGVPAPAYLANVAPLAAIYQTPIIVPGAGGGTATFTPYVWSYTANAGQAVLTCTAVSKFATQKRRGEFGRPNALPF